MRTLANRMGIHRTVYQRQWWLLLKKKKCMLDIRISVEKAPVNEIFFSEVYEDVLNLKIVLYERSDPHQIANQAAKSLANKISLQANFVICEPENMCTVQWRHFNCSPFLMDQYLPSEKYKILFGINLLVKSF